MLPGISYYNQCQKNIYYEKYYVIIFYLVLLTMLISDVYVSKGVVYIAQFYDVIFAATAAKRLAEVTEEALCRFILYSVV